MTGIPGHFFINSFMATQRGSLQFLLDMKHKSPELVDFIENINSKSDEDIDNLKEPKWIRQNLHKLKNKPPFINPMSVPVIESKINDPVGNVFQYNGSDFYAKSLSGRGMIEITSGSYIFEFDNFYIVGSLRIHKSTHFSHTTYIKEMTLLEYRTFTQEILLDKYSDRPPSEKEYPRKGVRIY